MAVIEFNLVSKSYRDPSIRYIFSPKITCGVKDLTFKVEGRETFGILGLNGAGKTTTLKLLLGLLRPDTGSITLFGKSPSDNKEILKYVGYLPEIPYFHKNLTAFETIYYLSILSNHKATQSDILEILKKVGLLEVAKRKVSTFSKGQLQRLGVAQSLIHNPELLVYDEPTSGLDPLGIKQMRQLIAELKSSGKTIILSSHLISEVEKLCDRVGILKDGVFVKFISAKEFSKPGELERIFVETVV